MKSYTVILRDRNDCELYRTECEGLKTAKDKARYILTDEFVQHVECSRETSHDDWGSDRVEVTNEADEIVFDLHLPVRA